MIRAKKVKQLLIVAQDKPGTLADVSAIIASEGANIDDICAYGMQNKAYFMVITNNNEKVKDALRKSGWKIEEDEVIAVELENRPGALKDMAAQLKANGINIKYCYGTSYEGDGPCHFIFKADDNNKALLALR